MISTNFVFKAERINKNFGETHANKDVFISLSKGEIRGLVGENGSGKSTFGETIAGILKKDSGVMYKDGIKYEPSNPLEANERKIGMVVQENGLIMDLSLGLNIFLGRLDQFSSFGILNHKKLNNAVRKILKKWELGNFLVENIANNFPIEDRKIIELVRVLSIDPDIIILDEITASLPHDKREVLYDIITGLKSQGKTILMISHDLEEVLSLSDRITIMRDGEIIDTVESNDLKVEKIKRLMVGRTISGKYYRNDNKERYKEEIVLKVEDLSVDKKLDNISFELHQKEILGICGLSDSGIHTIGKVLFGLEKPKKGKIHSIKKNKYITNTSRAILNGFGYVPKDRDKEALMLSASINDNICLPSIQNIQYFFGYINNTKKNKLADNAVKSFDIKAIGINQLVNDLSGGNRQKVNLSRWLIRNIEILILDCPTRGVDVGVKAYIYKVMNEAVKNGLSIIMISEELPELMGMSDRILIIKDGKINGSFTRSSIFSEESIVKVML